MSSPRYDWWPYIKGMIRRYPEMCRKYNDLHSPCISPSLSGMPRGGDTTRQTETLALRELPTTQAREYEAVRRAIETTEPHQLKLIDLLYWKRSHTIMGAAERLKIGERTAQRWHAEFIRRVALIYGLMDLESK